MIVNGLLTRVDSPASVDVAGVVTFSTGATVAIDVAIDKPTGKQRYVLGAAIKDVTAVVYVPLDSVDAIDPGYRIVCNKEGQDSKTYLVIQVEDDVLGGISHYELFCREA